MIKLELFFKALNINIYASPDVVKNHCEIITSLEKLFSLDSKQITLEQMLSVLHVNIKTSSSSEIKEACFTIFRVQEMNSGERDTIRATFENGPIFDGDVPSKSSLDMLLKDGLISKVVVKQEEGYNACTYKGAQAYRLIKAGACG